MSFHSAGQGSSSGIRGVILFGFQYLRGLRPFGQPSDQVRPKENETVLWLLVPFGSILFHPLLLIWSVLKMAREPEAQCTRGELGRGRN